MEHNFTFNSAKEIKLFMEFVKSVRYNYSMYQEIRNIIRIQEPPLPDMNDYTEIDLTALDERLYTALALAEEAETPKYEHRWAVKHNDEVLEEFDDLEEAFDTYTTFYKNDWAEDCYNDREYGLFDNELQVLLTNKTPQFSVEYRWEVSAEISCDGNSIYTDDAPEEVLDSMREGFYNGDEYDYYTYEHDGIELYHVKDYLNRILEERGLSNNAEKEREEEVFEF